MRTGKGIVIGLLCLDLDSQIPFPIHQAKCGQSGLPDEAMGSSEVLLWSSQ